MSAPTTVQWLRTAVHRVAVGSGRRATYLAAWAVHRARKAWEGATGWLGEGTGIGWWLRLVALGAVGALLRKVITAVAVGVYHRVEDGGALLWGAAACWIVSAYRAGADDWKPKRPAVPAAPTGSEETQETPEEAPGEEQPGLGAAQKTAAAPAVSPVALVAAVRDIGTPHAQLKPLAEHLGTTTDAVRAAAAGIGWPVKDVRQDGRSSSAGLRWDDCPSPTILAPSPGVVGAGQPADDNDDDSGGEVAQKRFRVVPLGSEGRIIYDSNDIVRHNKVVGQG